MLEVVGVESIDDLFVDIPKSVRLDGLLNLPVGITEPELDRHMRQLAAENVSGQDLVCFAGGGTYDHYRPAFLNSLVSRSEFFTAYTPYQPEVSQGTLQAIFEYQTGISELTGLPVANASMYDGATALVEATYMAARLAKRRNRVVVAGSIHPEYLEVLETYSQSGLVEYDVIPVVDGVSPEDAVIGAIDDTVAAVVLGYPNFYGCYEPVSGVIDAAHAVGALAIAVVNPIMLSLVEAPGSLGFDVAVGEGQPLGNAMSFGGPGLGFFACAEACIRQLPGRIVGQTVDSEGATAYVLTLSTREQHIRREKATSNICSNHSLNALIAGAYLAAAGQTGLRSVATLAFANAHYLCEQLVGTGRFARVGSAPFGYEFALKYSGDLESLYNHMVGHGILPGIRTSDDVLVVAVTEQRTVAECDRFVEVVLSHG